MTTTISLRSRSVVVAAVAFTFLLGPVAARAYPPFPQTSLNGPQLSASSSAASKNGVPLNIVRGVTTYKYGHASSAADFDRVSAQLAYWFRTLHGQWGGSALVNWVRAAAAEMGPGASPSDIADATSYQNAALNTIITAPFWASVAALAPGAEAVGVAQAGETGVAGTAPSGVPAGTPVAGGATGAAGSGAAANKAKGTINSALNGSTPDGSAASALSTASMATLAGAATIFVADNISADTQANVTGGWFQPLYTAVENYAWILAVIAIAMGGIYVMISSKGGELPLLLARIPYAAVLMVAVPVLVMVSMQMIDAICGDLMKGFPSATRMLHVMAATLGVLAGSSLIANHFHFAGIAHFTGAAAWFIGGFGLLTSGAIALELIAREIAVYLTVLIVPLALIGEIFSPFASWAMALLRVLFVVIVTKLLLALGLIIAGTLMLTGVTHFSPIDVVVGIVALLLIALFPALIYGALIRVESAWHTNVARNSVSAPSHSMVQHVQRAHGRVQTAIRNRSSSPPPAPVPPPRPTPTPTPTPAPSTP